MDYAVVSLSGRQYKVSEGQVFDIDRLPQEIGSKFETKDVLLVVNSGQVLVGQPSVDGAKVSFEVVAHPRGEKIRVSKFKAKSRYRKTIGFRADLTKIKVLKITTQSSSVKKTKKKTA